MISIIVSNKYFWGRDGAIDELNQVMEEEEQVETLLAWLEKDLPKIYSQLGGDNNEE